ncbi:MAG: hypothetical protein Q8P41_04840 [Pseudomonadota bacterium]|nr:hypothetical protein [Pseudomonadota bacterium]
MTESMNVRDAVQRVVAAGYPDVVRWDGQRRLVPSITDTIGEPVPAGALDRPPAP